MSFESTDRPVLPELAPEEGEEPIEIGPITVAEPSYPDFIRVTTQTVRHRSVDGSVVECTSTLREPDVEAMRRWRGRRS